MAGRRPNERVRKFSQVKCVLRVHSHWPILQNLYQGYEIILSTVSSLCNFSVQQTKQKTDRKMKQNWEFNSFASLDCRTENEIQMMEIVYLVAWERRNENKGRASGSEVWISPVCYHNRWRLGSSRVFLILTLRGVVSLRTTHCRAKIWLFSKYRKSLRQVEMFRRKNMFPDSQPPLRVIARCSFKAVIRSRARKVVKEKKCRGKQFASKFIFFFFTVEYRPSHQVFLLVRFTMARTKERQLSVR